MSTLRIVVALIALGAVAPAGATTFTYDLTADPADAVHTFQQILFLKDADTGSSVVPQISISPGDTVNVNITLSQPLTVPADSQVLLELQTLPDVNTAIKFAESFQYYDAGVQVTSPTGLVNIVGSQGTLTLGQLRSSFNSDPTPSFTFDAATFTATIVDIFQNGQPGVPSATLLEFSPQLKTNNPAPVPLPAAFWLLISGLGSLSVSRRASAR